MPELADRGEADSQDLELNECQTRHCSFGDIQNSSVWPSLKKISATIDFLSIRPIRGGNRLGGNIGCKDNTFSSDLIEFPNGSNIGSTL